MGLVLRNVKLIGVEGITHIYIENGIIEAIGEEPKDFTEDERIDCHGHIAIPAFINAHTHAYMTVFRNTADDMPFYNWLFEGVMPKENRMTKQQSYWSSLLGCAEMIRHGTGTYCDMHMFSGASEEAALKSGMRAVMTRGLSGSDGGDRRLNEQFAEMDIYGGIDTLTFMLAPHAIYTCDEEYLKKIIKIANEKDMDIHVHISESVTEINDCQKDHGCTPVKYLDSLGLFERKTLAAHCVQVTDEDIEILAKKGVSVALNPKSNLKLGNGIAPVKKMYDAGINLCIGTDSAASNNALNMFSEMNYTSMLHKGTNGDSTVISAKDSFEFATVNGAKALSIDKLGKIEVGYKADISIINTDVPQMKPLAKDIYPSLVYCADGSEVDTVIVNGKVLMKDRILLTIDEEELYYEINKIAEEL